MGDDMRENQDLRRKLVRHVLEKEWRSKLQFLASSDFVYGVDMREIFGEIFRIFDDVATKVALPQNCESAVQFVREISPNYSDVLGEEMMIFYGKSAELGGM